MIFQPAKNKHVLRIIATPIGNLLEISQRAINALQNAQCLLCEDTRVTKKMLAKLQINFHDKKFISFQKFNENDKVDLAINEIKSNNTVLVSDAGYPCLSDPGYGLVNVCYQNDITIEVINGPSALTHAMVVSGINLNNFYFNGFLPASKTQRIIKLKELLFIYQHCPIVFFESVHRICASLKDIDEIFTHPYFVVCKELTKINETIYRGTYEEIKDEIVEKGEFVVIVQKLKEKVIQHDNACGVQEVLKIMKKDPDMKLKLACKQIANRYHLSSSELYNAVMLQRRIK